MKRITILGLFVCLLSLTVNAQKSAVSLKDSFVKHQMPTQSYEAVKIVDQKTITKPTSAIAMTEGLVKTLQYTPLFMAPPVRDNSEEAKQLTVSPVQRAAFKNKIVPLFMAPTELTAENRAEILAASQEKVDINVEYNPLVQYRNPQAVIIPTAGATESFAVATGDFFYDPTDGVNGGPGGNCTTTSSGDPGDYPNCGCVTVTTLTGTDLSVEFLSFNIFGNFDILNIYDGPDTSSPQIYDSNLNTTTDTFAGMIAANGSGVFTSTSGALTFEFNATAVVNSCGWEVEVLNAGGGGGGATCSQEHPFSVNPGAGVGSSVNSDFKTAADIVVAAGEDFTLDTIEVPFLTLAPSDPPVTANIVYYEDAGGLPGTMIGSETVVPTILSSAPWANPVAIQFMTSLAVTPFTFEGDASVDTTYWIEISMGTATNQATVFWEATLDTPVEGAAAAQFNAAVGTWTVPDPLQEAIYTFSGECEPIGGGGTACSQDNPSNNFENGFTSSNSTPQVIAADITIPADTNLNLDSIVANWLVFDGEVIVSADITIYGDLAGLPDPSNIVASMSGVVPTSQPLLGDFPANPILDVLELNLDISPVMLNGQAGSTTTYWISIYVDNTSTNNSFWEFSSASVAGFEGAFSPDNGVTWGVATAGTDQVYEFSGECEPIGGGSGDACSQMQVSNAFENGYFMEAGGQLIANDFIVSPSTVNFSVESITANLFSQGGIDSVDIIFREDNAGLPGTQIGTTLSNVVPTSQNIIGNAFGFDVHETIIDLPTPVDFAGSGTSEEKIYWVQIVGHPTVPGTQMAWEVTSASVIGNPVAFDNLTGVWGSVPGDDGVFTINGICTFVPCPQPTNLVVSNITETTADLAWDAEPNATNGYEWFVFNAGDDPATDTPVDSGVTPAGTTTATADGLSNATSYDFYVNSDCGATGSSFLSGPVMFETLITPPDCGGKFYDTGGPSGDYDNDENITNTITPSPGELVTVTFTAFNVEETWDALYVYDGPDTNSPLISSGNPPTNSGFPAGGYYGTTNPGPFVSSHPTGALTFVFRSDNIITRAGWEADVTCALSPPPNDMIANSIDVDEIGFPYTDPGVHMPAATTEGGNPQNCDLTGANGVWYNFVAGGDGTAIATIVTPSGASSVTFYTAPNEDAVETDLTLVPQQTNQCGPGTSTSIFTLGGQAYYVFVLNTGAITDIVIDGTNLGILDNNLVGFSYHPNPTTDVLNLESVENIENVSLYNLLGQLVITKNNVNATTSQINLAGLSSGTYLMKVRVNGELGTYRVLKQ